MNDSTKIRLFLSSTFKDLQEERDLISTIVQPTLQRRFADRGLEISFIDLRWGITQQQSDRGEVLGLCFEEIDRCRPFFIGILGERVGSKPKSIPPAIKETCHWFDEDFGHSNTSLEMMYGAFHANPECKRSALFYFRQQSPKHSTVGQEEDEADQLEQLKQVLRSENLRLRPYRTPNDLAEQLLEDVSKLLETMYPKDGGDELESTWRQQVLFRQNCMASYVRRLELDIALAQTLAECKRVLVFGGKGVGKTFVLANWASTHSSPSAIAPRRQIAKFKGWQWRISKTLNPFLAASGCLGGSLWVFVMLTGTGLVLRLGLSVLAGIASYFVLALLVFGPLTLLFIALWRFVYPRSFPDDKRLYVFIEQYAKASENSTSWSKTSIRIIKELQFRLGIALDFPDRDPANSNRAKIELPRVLNQASNKGHSVTILLDGIDAFDENDLSWVPTELPSSVQFIVSSSSESHKEELKKMGWTVIDVSPMSDEEAACFVDQHMFKYGKYLSDEMRDQLCSHQFSRTPLYMKVVLDELAIAGTRRGVANTKNKLLAIDDAVGLLDSVVDRWEEVYSSAELDTVARTFAFLAIASGGLAEQELRQLVLAENNYPGTAWPAFFGSISWTLANDRGVYRIQNPDLVRVVSQKYLSCDETRIDLQEQLLEFCLGKGSDRHLVERCQLMRSLCRWNELADQLTNPRVFQAVKGLAVVEFWREIGEHSEVSVPERLIAFAKKINGIVLSSAYPFRKGDEIRGRDVNRVGCLLSILGHNEAAIEVFDIFISDYQKQRDHLIVGRMSRFIPPEEKVLDAARYKAEILCKESRFLESIELIESIEVGYLASWKWMRRLRKREFLDLMRMKSQILGMAGDLDQARAVAERYLHESAPEYPSDHCKQHESAGNLAAENGDFRKAIEHYSEMQKHARRDTDNPRDLIQSLYLQGLAFLRLGEFKASFDSLAKGEELARQHPVEDLLDRIFFTRAELQIVSGEPEKALETIERIDLDGRELPDLFRIGALDLLTIALSSVERWDEALKRCREAKECLGSHQNLNLRAQLDYRLASIQLEMQLYSDVVDSVDSSLSTLREPNAVILMQLLKCESLLELGRTDEASQTYQACIEVADSSDIHENTVKSLETFSSRLSSLND